MKEPILMNAIEIPTSKAKTLLLTFGCLAFVIASVYLWSIADVQTSKPPMFIKTISVAGIIFFGLGLILGPRKLFDNRPGLIIDSNGIQDNSSVSTGRFIKWENITRFETIQIRRTKILLIFINNAEEIINNESGWRHKLMRISERTYGTPISITSGTLKISFDELQQLLSDNYNLHQHR